MKKLMTLCVIQQGSRVLLGIKKRGFGAGRWNGFGGKVREGETVEEAAGRELREETGITPVENSLERAGIIEFEFQNHPDVLEVHIFRVNHYAGVPIETDEMKPEWFPLDEIPFEQMWPNDKYWIPLFLEGKKFRGRMLFDDPKDTHALDHSLSVVEELE